MFIRMQRTLHLLIIIVSVITWGTGCERTDPAPPDSPDTSVTISSSEKQRLLDDVARAEREAQYAEAPNPTIVLSTPPGWTKGEPQPLPPIDHGFTVAYEHESGLAVTLYQFTRGHSSIPNDVNSPLVKEEMVNAKNGIEQAVQVGLWQSAKESTSQTVYLGYSQQQALWSQYYITADGMTLASDIYVWSQANTLFKLRCTSRKESVTSNKAVLDPLLTALGSSSLSTSE